MKFKDLPAVVMLIAGLIVCIVTYIYQYNVIDFLLILLFILILFYFIGLIMRFLFNRILSEGEDEEDDNQEETPDDEDSES